ncbi:hypothetical protein FRC10_009340 [Ceratobasidium sp. 414]|nr:hypothetical protein FRC10_009340 [Ceratobasidium sp. 414]
MSTKICKTGEFFASCVDAQLNIFILLRWFSFGANAYVVSSIILSSTVGMLIRYPTPIEYQQAYPSKHFLLISEKRATQPARVQLTRDKPSQTGWLWSRLPLTAANYQIDIEYKVSGGSSHLYGDGMAIWLTNTRAEPGPVFGSIDKFEGLGIFIDTYANARHSYSFPRIMAMLGDGKTSYDVGSDGAKTELAACSANIRKTDISTKLRLTYFKGEYLNLAIQYKGWDEWTECFTVWDVTLPVSPFLGFSALTGDVSDNHDIISVSTATAVLKEASATPQRRQSSSPSGFWGFVTVMLKLAAFALVCVAALAGWRAYSRGGKRRGGGAFGGLGGGMPQWDSKNKHF